MDENIPNACEALGPLTVNVPMNMLLILANADWTVRPLLDLESFFPFPPPLKIIGIKNGGIQHIASGP